MIIGHQKKWQLLKKSYSEGKMPHGYLFSGPDGIGKKTLAIEFARFVNCQQETEKRPCSSCPSCRALPKGIHPDFSFLSCGSGQKEIQISQARNLIYKLSLRPSLSSYKIVIIDEAHLMNDSTQSCLLKTLEEPKGSCLLILVTSYPEVLFETVRSRLQEIKFSFVPDADILMYLKRQGVVGQQAREILRMSGGRIGRAIEALENPQKIERQKKWTRALCRALSSDMDVRFHYADLFSKEPRDELFEAWLGYFREKLLIKTGNIQGEDSLSRRSLLDVKRIIDKIEFTNFLISTRNINKRLAFEILMMQI